MISKELLSEVLKKEIREFVIEKNELRYILKDDINNIPELYFINIYELSHKCKEWAFNQGYSYIGNNKLLNIYREDSQMICIINKDIINWFDINVDFIACEWILKEQNNDTK